MAPEDLGLGQPTPAPERFAHTDPQMRALLIAQEGIVRQLGQTSGADGPSGSRFSVSDPIEEVVAWVREGSGRSLGTIPLWLRIWQPDTGRGVLFVLSAPRPGDEAELLIVANPGALSRQALRAAAHWAFVIVGLRRLVARIPTGQADLLALAKRAGFAWEGIARDAFGDGQDAAMLAMTVRSCRWLQCPTSPVLQGPSGPLPSKRIH